MIQSVSDTLFIYLFVVFVDDDDEDDIVGRFSNKFFIPNYPPCIKTHLNCFHDIINGYELKLL